MKLNKIFYRSVLIIAVAISCSKTETKTPTCYPLQENQLNPDGSIFSSTTYVYDDSNLLVSYSTSGTSIVGTYTYRITRNSKGYITQIDGMEPGPTQTKYTYDVTNKLTNKLFLANGLNYTSIYLYNSFNQVSKVKYAITDTTLGYVTYVYKYPNTNTKNASSVEYYDSNNNLIVTTPYTYDSKKSTYGVCFPGLPGPYGLFSLNNVLTAGLGSNYSDTYTYQYNAEGFPISGTRTNQSGGFTDNIPLTYTYNCK